MKPRDSKWMQALDSATRAALPDEELQELVRFARGDAALLRRTIKRRVLGDPLVYVTGSCEVLGRSFDVDRRVYRPSQNTAKLLTHVLRGLPDGLRIVDMGTGCGWMAITLKLERPHTQVVGVDIDPGAIEVARHNAARHGVDVSFVVSDFFEDFGGEMPDLVVANLPYGTPNPTSRFAAINAHMPQIALYHPEGPLAALNEMLASLERKRWSPAVFVETGSLREQEVRDALPSQLRFDYIAVEPGFSILHIPEPCIAQARGCSTSPAEVG